MDESDFIEVDQLRVGQYVYLDLKWFDHPFAFSHFKIQSNEEISIIQSLGLKRLRCNIELSDSAAYAEVGKSTRSESVKPAASESAKPTASEPARTAESESAKAEPDTPLNPPPVMSAKQVIVAQMALRQKAVERIESALVNTALVVRDIEKNAYSQPAQTLETTTKLIQKMADSILNAPELAIQVMVGKARGEEVYLHSLNVSLLSMIVARDLKLPIQLVSALGIGALLHDIGRKEVPDKVLLKTGPLTTAERKIYELHTQYGLDYGKRMKLPPEILGIIGEHHELFDGSGYPAKLKGESIGFLARIVVIANFYDELCNPAAIADALTPHEALSLMFAKFRSKFDPNLLKGFIRNMGVYPPGTIVQLSNGALGMVTTVNTSRPMKPMVMVYDADAPKAMAIYVDLDVEPELNIAKAVRPAQVPREVYGYLCPRRWNSYYFDAVAANRTGNNA